MLSARLREGLRRIADLADPAHLAQAERRQLAAWNYEPPGRLPSLLLDVRPPEWPPFPYRETLDDPEKALWNELLQPYVGVHLRDDRMLTVRPHFGSGTVASLFGARTVRFADEVPWVEPLGSNDAIRDLVARGIPDLEAGFGAKVFEWLRVYRDYLAECPHVRIFLADTQGPLDTALLLWGPRIYFAMREDPALVHALLDLITETTIAFTRAEKEIAGEARDSIVHFWYRVPAGVRVVDDVAINISPAMYEEFSRPYNERIFAAFGGGYMHYCGHLLKSHELRLATRGLRGIEMGFDNPGRSPAYTLESIWASAARRRVAILWIAEAFPETFPRIPTGLVYGCKLPAVAWEDAPAVLVRLRAALESQEKL
ncbi:MAG: hypothetical protein ACE15B_00640 [Bryobacteraceae bacterium]